MSSYVTPKWGLEGMIHAMRMEMEGTGVRVSTVRPGPTVSGMGAGWDMDVVAPLLEEWNRWGLMRHDGYLSADGVASAVVGDRHCAARNPPRRHRRPSRGTGEAALRRIRWTRHDEDGGELMGSCRVHRPRQHRLAHREPPPRLGRRPRRVRPERRGHRAVRRGRCHRGDVGGRGGTSCDVISVMVLDDDQVRIVVAELLTTASAGTVIGVHSTIRPETAEELEVTAAEHGVSLLDAPVSGGPTGAAEGRMAVLVGGDREAYERAREPFGRWAEVVVHFGARRSRHPGEAGSKRHPLRGLHRRG